MIHMLNGKIVEEQELMISARDIGLLRGFVVFDFLVTYNNKPFMLNDHIDRLYNSAKNIKLYNPWTKLQIRKMIYQALNANNSNFDKTIKLVLTGGVSSDGFTPENKSQLLILIDEWRKSPANIYKKGICIIAHKHKRHLAESKTNNYVEALKNLGKIKKKSAFEILYYDESQIFECSRSNIFALIDGKLQTPKSNILKGITRKVVLEKLDLQTIEQDFTFPELLKAEEIFITKSNDEIVPIIKIDNQIIGNGKVGKITKEVMKKFQGYIKNGDW